MHLIDRISWMEYKSIQADKSCGLHTGTTDKGRLTPHRSRKLGILDVLDRTLRTPYADCENSNPRTANLNRLCLQSRRQSILFRIRIVSGIESIIFFVCSSADGQSWLTESHARHHRAREGCLFGRNLDWAADLFWMKPCDKILLGVTARRNRRQSICFWCSSVCSLNFFGCAAQILIPGSDCLVLPYQLRWQLPQL